MVGRLSQYLFNMKSSSKSDSFITTSSDSEINSRAYQRLRVLITRGNLWLYILRMLLDRQMYAYEMKKRLSVRFGFTPATVTVYVILYKLRQEGLIRIERESPTLGRPVRKYYAITDLGREELQKGRKLLGNVLRLLE